MCHQQTSRFNIEEKKPKSIYTHDINNQQIQLHYCLMTTSSSEFGAVPGFFWDVLWLLQIVNKK